MNVYRRALVADSFPMIVQCLPEPNPALSNKHAIFKYKALPRIAKMHFTYMYLTSLA